MEDCSGYRAGCYQGSRVNLSLLHYHMPAAAAASEQQPMRTWWSLSRSPSTKDLRQGYPVENKQQQPKPSGKFTSFASAIGLKSKKHTPSLAIQEPPPPVPPVVKIQTSPRPSSKSLSSTRTRVDSFEPRTPIDLKRQSLLTLSDTDPFAGRSVIAVPVPHLPSDPNRLSAYSTPSVTNFIHKKPDTNRVSYASSSSTSHVHAIEILPTPPVFTRITSELRRLPSKYVTAIFMQRYLTFAPYRRSAGSLQVKYTEPLTRRNSVSPSMSSSSNLGSSSVYRRSQPDPAVTRPKIRARGMTDGGSTQKAGFFVRDPPPSRKLSHTSPSSNTSSQNSPISPKVIIRQASVSRLQTPPSAPPTQRLPPPPSQAEEPTSSQLPGVAYQIQSALSSSLSLGSMTSSAVGAPYGVQDHERFISDRGRASQRHKPDNFVGPTQKESKSAPGSLRTLKKSNSHQMLSRRNNHTSQSATPEASPEATSRKQRSLAHPRLPIPHIPLSARPSSASNATIFPSLPEFGQTPTSDSRKRSSSGRRRLFSGSSISKLSLSQQTSNRDDDTLSTFSLRSDRDLHLGFHNSCLSTKGTRPSSSFWEEASDYMPGSPVRSPSEYTPQVIMSREELARLEESVENTPPAYSSRSRGFSVLSESTMASDYDKDSDFSPVGLSPPPPATRPNSKQMQIWMSSNSFPAKPSSILSQPNSPPPSILSTADDHHEGAMQTKSPTLSPQTLVMTSLPPPPRRRRPTLISEADLSDPTSPPFSSHFSLIQKSSSMRSKFTVEKTLHRQSVMRKPSFLDIGDDSDQETESEIDELVTGSFLDLARESFDTIRSEA